PALGSASSPALGGGDRPRRRPKCERTSVSQDRRSQRLSTPAGGRLSIDTDSARVESQRRTGPLPPRDVHPLLALCPPPSLDGLRRARGHHGLYASQPLQYSPPGTDSA